MSSTKKRGGRRLRVALASAIAALGVSAVGVSSASAVTATFDHGSLKLPAASFEIITPDDPVLLANFPADGAYSIVPGDVTFPTFSGEALPGVNVDVTLAPQENLTGTYTAATGTMTGDASDWLATLAVNGDPCVIGPFPMAFTTANNAVFQGDLFDAASSPPVNGSISNAWTGLPAGVGDGCGLINALTSGAGGIWLSNNVATPTLTPPPEEPPVTPPTETPTKKKCKKAKKKKGKAAAAKKKKCKKKKKKKK